MVADLLIVTFPLLLVWFVGLRGPAVLSGGRWSDLAAGSIVYLGLCGVGIAALAASIVRWQVRRPPTVLFSNHSKTVDIAERLGYAPWGKNKRGSFRLAAGEQGAQSPGLRQAIRSAASPRRGTTCLSCI